MFKKFLIFLKAHFSKSSFFIPSKLKNKILGSVEELNFEDCVYIVFDIF